MPGVMAAVAVSPTVTPGALGRTWYVDSVAGDDGKDGMTPATAYQTISALVDIQAGDTINLARGAHWREELTVTVDRVTVRAYGAGDAPILDASNLVSGGAWTKTAGRTNVYQFSATPDWYAGKSEFAVWEDGAFLPRAADVAACDSTAGSHAISGTSGTITVYVHATGSTNPAGNGKTYEHTQRQHGLDGIDASRLSLANIETRNNLHADGSTRAGTLARLSGCTFRNGNAHNVYVADGLIADCTVIDAYVSHDSGAMIIWNQNTPAGQTCTVRGCTVVNNVTPGTQQGMYGHANVSGAYGAVLVEDSTWSGNLSLAISMAYMASLTVTGCTFDLVQGKNAIALRTDYNAPHTLSDCTHNNADGRLVSIETANVQITISGNQVQVGNTASAAIYAVTTPFTATISGNTFSPAAGLSGNRVAIWAVYPTATVVCSGNAFTMGANHYAYLAGDGISALTSDYNTFAASTRVRWTGWTDYIGLAAWQAAASQDAHSTELP